MHHTRHSIPYPGAGIVTFPSYHSAVAVILMYASWPYRWLRLVIVPLNIAVLLSTPFNGGHYLSDVLGGVAIAYLGIILAERLLPYKDECLSS
jgi:membrane-associated phospholipid phosphatase